MAKEDKSVWLIFFEGIKIYCLNIHKFLLYMAFPVLGQLVGLFLIFGLTYWYTQNLQELTSKFQVLNDFSIMLLCIILSVIPGLLIWTKAFWDYLVSYGALNSMTDGYLNTGKVYDFKAHNSVVTKKTFSFIALWFLFSIFTLISVIPIFWIIGFVFFIYFILVFQVSAFENGLSPVGYFRRSLQLVKGKFSRTFLLMTILVIFTYYLLSAGLGVIFDALNITKPLSKVFEVWAYSLPIEPLESYHVTPALIGKEVVKQIVFFIVVGFTLPLRSICWTLWYTNLAGEVDSIQPKPKKKSKKGSVKKVSGKTFKIEKRGIDPEIIRRARLEDDEY
jgi:membrane protein